MEYTTSSAFESFFFTQLSVANLLARVQLVPDVDMPFNQVVVGHIMHHMPEADYSHNVAAEDIHVLANHVGRMVVLSYRLAFPVRQPIDHMGLVVILYITQVGLAVVTTYLKFKN